MRCCTAKPCSKFYSLCVRIRDGDTSHTICAGLQGIIDIAFESSTLYALAHDFRSVNSLEDWMEEMDDDGMDSDRDMPDDDDGDDDEDDDEEKEEEKDDDEDEEEEEEKEEEKDDDNGR